MGKFMNWQVLANGQILANGQVLATGPVLAPGPAIRGKIEKVYVWQFGDP